MGISLIVIYHAIVNRYKRKWEEEDRKAMLDNIGMNEEQYEEWLICKGWLNDKFEHVGSILLNNGVVKNDIDIDVISELDIIQVDGDDECIDEDLLKLLDNYGYVFVGGNRCIKYDWSVMYKDEFKDLYKKIVKK